MDSQRIGKVIQSAGLIRELDHVWQISFIVAIGHMTEITGRTYDCTLRLGETPQKLLAIGAIPHMSQSHYYRRIYILRSRTRPAGQTVR